MKKSFTLIVLSFVTVWALALPKVHVIATGGTIAGTSSGSGYEAGSVFKNNSHAIDAYASVTPDYYMPHDANTGFDISNVETLPQVGIIYGYGGCSTLPMQAFMDADYDGVVLAGVGGGNFYAPVQQLAEQAVAKGMKIVRSTRCPYGGVYTVGGEVEDLELGFIAAGCLNPQKARILLMLALTQTNDTEKIRDYFSKAIVTEIRQMRVAERAASVRAYTLQGTPATVSTRGIVIQNQIKIVRK